MIARYFYDGAVHSFIAGLTMRPDGTTGPPQQMAIRLNGNLFSRSRTLLLEYDHVDPERDVLMYRVVGLEEE